MTASVTAAQIVPGVVVEVGYGALNLTEQVRIERVTKKLAHGHSADGWSSPLTYDLKTLIELPPGATRLAGTLEQNDWRPRIVGIIAS